MYFATIEFNNILNAHDRRNYYFYLVKCDFKLYIFILNFAVFAVNLLVFNSRNLLKIHKFIYTYY